jgi:two-component system, NarL family, nitrate/nitrite response regulator NarL
MRVLLADDHQLLRDTIAAFLQGEKVEVLSVGTFSEALTVALARSDLDLVLLDIDMPGMNGLEGLSEMCRKRPDIPVGLLSGNTDFNVVLDGFQRGAKGFIPKNAGLRNFMNAVRLISAGDRYIPPLLIEQIQSHLKLPAPIEPASADQAFSTREKRILQLLKDGLSNKQIARQLSIEDYTVKHHLRRIFKKLSVENRTQAVRAALERQLP